MKLNQVARIFSGYPFRGKIPEAVGSPIRAIQMKDVSLETGIDWNSCVKTELNEKKTSEWLKPGDILFAARGNHNYAALVDQTAEQIKAVAAPHFYIIRCIPTQILPDYLVWLLNQDFCQNYYQREAEGTFTKSIRRSVLEATPIVVPTLAKQGSIIQLVKTFKQQEQVIKQLIHNNNKLIKAINLKDSIYDR